MKKINHLFSQVKYSINFANINQQSFNAGELRTKIMNAITTITDAATMKSFQLEAMKPHYTAYTLREHATKTMITLWPYNDRFSTKTFDMASSDWTIERKKRTLDFLDAQMAENLATCDKNPSLN